MFGIAKDEKRWCVYVHTNKVNGKKYVGITCREPEVRWQNGKAYKHNVYFTNAIQKYGWENFKHEVLLTNETLEFANKVEKCLIKAYKCKIPNGYNMTDGGDGTPGHILSDESKQKMSKSLKERYKNGLKAWNCGLPATEKQRERLRNASLNRVFSEETRKKLSEARKGKKPGNAGKPLSKETKEKISKSLKGHITTDETREKIGRANKNKRTSVESSRHRPVYCIELNEIFWGAKEATNKYGFGTANIGACCRGIRNYTGNHPITLEPLHWMYAEKAIELNYISKEQLDNYLNNLK